MNWFFSPQWHVDGSPFDLLTLLRLSSIPVIEEQSFQTVACRFTCPVGHLLVRSRTRVVMPFCVSS
jgi:hypothetical protein